MRAQNSYLWYSLRFLSRKIKRPTEPYSNCCGLCVTLNPKPILRPAHFVFLLLGGRSDFREMQLDRFMLPGVEGLRGVLR